MRVILMREKEWRTGKEGEQWEGKYECLGKKEKQGREKKCQRCK